MAGASQSARIGRREFLAAAASLAALPAVAATPTDFQLACMTLPYSPFPLDRALEGIARSGYPYVAWGTQHTGKDGQRKPMLPVEAPVTQARELARRCRDRGLEPVMMFATVHLEAPEALPAHLRRIEQAAASGIPYLLTFGRTEPGMYDSVIKALQGMAGPARQANVTVVIKQHGGNSATGADCAKILRDVGEDSIKICYDAGNVLDYENQDPIPDIQTCWRDVRAFAIKDHRNFPQDQDCGPGFGEIDHYKLLTPVLNTGLKMPLACENIFAPLVPRPAQPEGVDALALRSRLYLETVIAGLRANSQRPNTPY